MNTAELPEHPAELLRLALADLEACEADDDYAVHMNYWHVHGVDVTDDDYGQVGGTFDESTCIVCLAGSVMAQTLGLDFDCDITPRVDSPFAQAISNKLYALDEFRTGHVGKALYEMDLFSAELDASHRHWHVCPYSNNPDRFKRDMRAIADYLDTLTFENREAA